MASGSQVRFAKVTYHGSREGQVQGRLDLPCPEGCGGGAVAQSRSTRCSLTHMHTHTYKHAYIHYADYCMHMCVYIYIYMIHMYMCVQNTDTHT